MTLSFVDPPWIEEFHHILKRDVDLKSLTSVRVGGLGRIAFVPTTVAEVRALLGRMPPEDYLLLGGGTNAFFEPPVVGKPIILLEGLVGTEQLGERGLRINAGVGTAQAITRTRELGLEGLHVLAGVPGQIGGACTMNAGTRKGEIVEVISSLEVVLPGGDLQRLKPEELDYGYRRSGLPAGAVVTSADFLLTPTEDPKAFRRTIGSWLKEKNESQPTRTWNFGCMFKNLPGRPAGLLVDQAGLKGLQIGGARISPVHANFLENVENAQPEDLIALLRRCETEVKKRFGVDLEREVRALS